MDHSRATEAEALENAVVTHCSLMFFSTFLFLPQRSKARPLFEPFLCRSPRTYVGTLASCLQPTPLLSLLYDPGECQTLLDPVLVCVVLPCPKLPPFQRSSTCTTQDGGISLSLNSSSRTSLTPQLVWLPFLFSNVWSDPTVPKFNSFSLPLSFWFLGSIWLVFNKSIPTHLCLALLLLFYPSGYSLYGFLFESCPLAAEQVNQLLATHPSLSASIFK